MNVKRNFIGGEWVGASAAKPNVNPSDTSDVVGEYAQADAAQMAAAVSAARAGQIFRFFAGEAVRAGGERLPSVRAGLPHGVFNLVMGPGSRVGQTLISHPGVDAITFTGSVGTGRRVMSAAAGRLAKVQLEMGGKNPLVVLDDAELERAVEVALQGMYYSTGQRCTASSRLIVQRGILPRFVDALVERLKALEVDDARKPGTHIGPVVDASQLEQDLAYIDIGRDEGARLAFGGRRLQREREGFYLEPALFVDAAPDMRIAREEIFGPVACVIAADDYEHALALANDTEFGLSAGLCTTSLKHATHFKRHAQSGMVMVNVPTAGVDYHVPFGGRKGSSFGPREQGRHAQEFFTTLKTAYTAA